MIEFGLAVLGVLLAIWAAGLIFAIVGFIFIWSFHIASWILWVVALLLPYLFMAVGLFTVAQAVIDVEAYLLAFAFIAFSPGYLMHRFGWTRGVLREKPKRHWYD